MMEENEMQLKIGVMDSGVGGLTVVNELQKIIPDATILYYGDSGNCPYGNRSQKDIIELSKKIIDFLLSQEVDFICIACNTISTVIEKLQKDCPIKLIGIIQPVSNYIATVLNPKEIGLVATVDTVQSQEYSIKIHEKNKHITVIGQGSPTLAALIESGEFTTKKIDAEIQKEMQLILQKNAIYFVILGCTHYPIVEDHFKKLYPKITFINPAHYQALVANKVALDKPIKQNTGTDSSIYTSGDTSIFSSIVEKIGIKTQQPVKKLVL